MASGDLSDETLNINIFDLTDNSLSIDTSMGSGRDCVKEEAREEE